MYQIQNNTLKNVNTWLNTSRLKIDNQTESYLSKKKKTKEIRCVCIKNGSLLFSIGELTPITITFLRRTTKNLYQKGTNRKLVCRLYLS